MTVKQELEGKKHISIYNIVQYVQLEHILINCALTCPHLTTDACIGVCVRAC